MLLEWHAPRDIGHRDDLSYNVLCRRCHSSERRACQPCDDSVAFVPGKRGLKEVRVEISKLRAHTSYTFDIQVCPTRMRAAHNLYFECQMFTICLDNPSCFCLFTANKVRKLESGKCCEFRIFKPPETNFTKPPFKPLQAESIRCLTAGFSVENFFNVGEESYLENEVG